MRTLLFSMAMFCGSILYAQEAKPIKLDDLQQLIQSETDKIKIINFWATWCGPCVKELPHFDAFGQQNKSVEMYFVSLDFPSQLDKANKVLENKDIKATSFLLDEKDADKFILTIDKNWSGAIPATLFINNKNGKRVFYEHALEQQELEEIVKTLL